MLVSLLVSKNGFISFVPVPTTGHISTLTNHSALRTHGGWGMHSSGAKLSAPGRPC